MFERPKDKTKEHSVGIRLGNDTFEALIKASEELNLNKSQVLIQAFHEWLIQYKSKINMDMMFISKNLFKDLLSTLDDKVISEFAQKAGRSFSIKFRLNFKKHPYVDSIIDVVSVVLRQFEPKRYNWVHSAEFMQLEDSSYNLQIIHNSDEKASKFFLHFFEIVLGEIFQFQLNKSSITEETVDLIFVLDGKFNFNDIMTPKNH